MMKKELTSNLQNTFNLLLEYEKLSFIIIKNDAVEWLSQKLNLSVSTIESHLLSLKKEKYIEISKVRSKQYIEISKDSRHILLNQESEDDVFVFDIEKYKKENGYFTIRDIATEFNTTYVKVSLIIKRLKIKAITPLKRKYFYTEKDKKLIKQELSGK